MKLFTPRGSSRGDLETSILLVVENNPADVEGVEVRLTVPVDQPIHADECHGVQLTDDSFVLGQLKVYRLGVPGKHISHLVFLGCRISVATRTAW